MLHLASEVEYFSDCYLFSRITHYEQRLRTLYYLKRFPERRGDIKPKVKGMLIPTPSPLLVSAIAPPPPPLPLLVSAIVCFTSSVERRGFCVSFSNVMLIFLSLLAMTEASKQVFRSRKFRDLLEVVLAFGNYMNRGARGNAAGRW